MKKRNYKIGIITLTLIFVFNLVLMSVSSVFAANQYGQTGAKNEAEKITFATRIKEAFVECLKNDSMLNGHQASDYGDHHLKDYYVTPAEIFKTNNVFTNDSDFPKKATVVKVGKDIEAIINPGDSNGKIYCYEGTPEKNLTTLFMDAMGIDNIKQLICSSTGNYALYDGGVDNCSVDNLNLSAKLSKKDSKKSIEYINDIYSKWSKKQNNGILTGDSEKDKVSSNATMSYTEALNAFEKECLGQPGVSPDGKDKEQYSSGGGTYYYDFKIKMIKDGNTVELFPHLGKDKDGNDFNKSGIKTVEYYKNSEKLTCKDLADTINNNFDEYKKSIESIRKDKYVKPCASAEIKKRANEIVSSYVKQEEKKKASTPSYFNKGLVSTPSNPLISTDSNLSVTKEEYDKVLAAVKSDDFTVDDGNGGKKCLETENLKPCNTVEKKTQAKKLLEDYIMRSQGNGTPLTEAESAEFTKIKSAIDHDDFTVDDGNGGKKCLETENFNSTLPPDEAEWTADGEYDSSTSEEQKQSYCQENGGFLSWMLCPAIADGAATASGLLGSITALTNVHTSIIEQFSKQDSSIYKAWSAFRNIANIGFVIMLLVIVFSQVTNIGISNYNIKKILPKLIITAILVNFSYLIMGVLIDLSQIVGNGIGVLIRSVAADGMDVDASTRASATISTIAGAVIGVAGAVGAGAAISGAITGVAGAASAGTIVAGLVGGPAIILPVVMFIITSLISVFFGFVMLTIRQAAIIMVVVLAPLAMVLYALPNTAAITKKYFSIVKALLMLYPMFIFATSAGALASSIIIGTSTDLLMMIVGGLLNVLPYFAIPSMTSKSLAGLGAITGAFDKMRGGVLKGASMAGGAIAASEFYKNIKSNYAADQSVARAKRDLRKFDKIKADKGKLSIAQMRRQAAAAGIVNSDSKLRAGSDSAGRGALSNMSGLGFENLEATAEKEFRDGEVKNIMNKLANDGVNEATMESDLRKALGADYTTMTKEEKRANDVKIEALTRALGATKNGRKIISDIGKDTSLSMSNRAFTQLASAAVTLPGFSDKQQIANRQFNEYLQSTSYIKDAEGSNPSLISATRSKGLDKAYDDMTMDNFLKVGNEDAAEILGAKGANSLDSVVRQTASAALKDPNLISNFDKTKMSLVSAEMDNQRKTTINLRNGGTAQVFNPPSDFGDYSQTKHLSGEIIYTNSRGDRFNASTGQITKGI